MINESDIINYMADHLGKIKMPGYSTIEIEVRKGSCGITHKATAYNEHSGIHRGDTISDAVMAANEAYKPLHEKLIDNAAKLRANADSMEAKAKELLAMETPALI
jgi:hypothetical protein